MKDIKTHIVILAVLVAMVTALACAVSADFVTRAQAHDDDVRQHGSPQTTVVIIATGMGMAALLSIAGMVWGWRWLNPIERLVTACRQTGDLPLPENSGLKDVDQLACVFNERLSAERHARQQLAEAHERESTAHAVHRRFIHQLGHELGQPLRQIISISERFESHPDVSAAHDVRQCALSLEEKFQDIMGLVGESTQTSASTMRHNIRVYAQSLVNLLQPKAQAKKLTLTALAPDTEAVIAGSVLTPVLINLLSNALDATTQGEISLRAEFQTDKGTMTWTIQDTGSGISGDMAERITAACQRGEVIPGEPGFGLGLTLAIENVRILHGRIELVTQGPQGSTFRITLPG